jgi:hypothetical protein
LLVVEFEVCSQLLQADNQPVPAAPVEFNVRLKKKKKSLSPKELGKSQEVF